MYIARHVARMRFLNQPVLRVF